MNNAGVTRDNPLFRMSEDDWDVVLDVHLRGTFLVLRAVQADIVEAEWAGSSTSVAVGARQPRAGEYAAAKAGVRAPIAEATAVRRVGMPDGVAGLVSYSSSAKAGFVSGQVKYVAGGPVD